MPSLTTATALTILQASLSSARSHGYRPMAVVVVDAAGQVVASVREDGAAAMRLDIALGKTGAAICMGANSKVLAQYAKDMPVFFGAIAATAQQKFIPQTGAVLIVDAAGAVLGAAGASGGTGEEDEVILIDGIAAAGLSHR